MTARLQSLHAIVTGGGRGIGAAVASLFASHGANVTIASRTQSQLDQVASAINKECGEVRAQGIAANVCVEDDVRRLFDAAISNFGPVDILVNNAAVITVKPFDELSVDEWDQTMAINLRGPFLCSREAFVRMKGRGGSIIHIGSLAGIRGTEKFPGMSSYVVSKHGIVGLTESLAVEGRPHGIRVNCVAPGAVDTQMLHEAAPQIKTETKPLDIAHTLLYLADPIQAAKVTGTIVEIHSNA